MFNLKSFLSQPLFGTPQSPQVTIAEIHKEFDSATDKLLDEAKNIIAKKENDKGVRLEKLGFVSANDAVRAAALEKEKAEKRQIANLIEHYSIYYPNNKFITESLVKQICEKYGLVFADVRYYKGDVPEKNIAEMEEFKLRYEEKEGFVYTTRGLDSYLGMNLNGDIDAIDHYMRLLTQGLPQYNAPKQEKYQPPFKICAPEKDFDMRNLVRVGYKLAVNLPDPIVLQPVKGGYLIVTKWGLEASDEDVVNEKMN